MSTTSAAATKPTQQQAGMTGMAEMASAMTVMANMCQEMMRREAAARP